MSTAVLIREPLGQRRAQLPLLIGGVGADLLVPGESVALQRIESDGKQWVLHAMGDTPVVINGCVQQSPAALNDHDVIRAGDAQLVVWPSAGHVDVAHLAGNATVASIRQHVLPGEEVIAGVREIVATAAASTAANRTLKFPARRGELLIRAALGALLTLVLAIAAVLFTLVPVAVQLAPAAANVQVQGWFNWHSGGRIFLLPGRRQIEFSLAGYRTQRITLNVTRDLAQAASLPVTLALLPGVLAVTMDGEAGELFVDGKSVAHVPGDVLLEPGSYNISVRAPRFVDFSAQVDVVGGGRRQALEVQLQPATGWLVIDALLAGARVNIDGRDLGAVPQRLELASGLHKLALAAAGRRSWNSQIAIIAGQTLDLGRIDLALPAPEGLGAPAPAPVAAAVVAPPAPQPQPPASRVRSALLGTLVLLPAGTYQQGSERREQGRRANEVQRMVTLTRPFYLSETEVSNVQFRAFGEAHVAGLALEKSLDLDTQAVSNVSWDDAVEFCNWLSLREGFPVAYERRDGRWQLVQPLSVGYRLPTEAEWEYAARYVDGQRWQRYSWGDSLPPPAAAANLAGQESFPTRPGPEVRLATALPGYRDEHPVIAPVSSYAKSAPGLLNMGGNVSEWMHDVYGSLPESGEIRDPFGMKTDGPHSIRGASWRTAAIAELRLAWRERAAAPGPTIGFRVARYAEIKP